MILLLDAGNTRMKWACLVGGVLQSGEALARSGVIEDDVRNLSLAWAPMPPPRRILGASVVGQGFIAALSASTMETWSVPIEAVSARQEGFGVINGYAVPERLGADRWLALVAARRIEPGAVCVVDCGTAITIDVMHADGVHLGGLIMPGLGFTRRMLIAAAHGISIEGGGPAEEVMPAYADDTEAAFMGGTLCAAVAGIDRAVGKLREVVGDLHCLITGGDAARLAPLLADSYNHQPELVLKGLAAVAEADGE